MALKAVTPHFWIFQGWFGSLVEVQRSEFPTQREALLEARRKYRGE